ncbi:PhzF family phenazine biosynthesis protein [Bacteroidota bacterium]
MNLKIFQVDAFTSRLFKGNPAAVVPLEEWLDDKTMQNIALENNLSETAFIVKEEDYYKIRWMTPTLEVPLCGHATLASAFVIFNYFDKEQREIVFDSKSGRLIVTKEDDLLSLNFPANKPEKVEIPDDIVKVVSVAPNEVLFNKSYLAIFDSEEQIRDMKPDIRTLKNIHADGLIISARGNSVDFVSRFFVPSAGIDEDPVTGYAHTILTPYWSEKLGKKKMSVLQVSARGGELQVEDLGGRVKISGKAVLYMMGEIKL